MKDLDKASADDMLEPLMTAFFFCGATAQLRLCRLVVDDINSVNRTQLGRRFPRCISSIFLVKFYFLTLGGRRCQNFNSGK
jgi:hypothetical protein